MKNIKNQTSIFHFHKIKYAVYYVFSRSYSTLNIEKCICISIFEILAFSKARNFDSVRNICYEWTIEISIQKSKEKRKTIYALSLVKTEFFGGKGTAGSSGRGATPSQMKIDTRFEGTN